MIQLRLLGPVELHVPGRVLDVGPPKRRALLAALAVDAGRPVPVDTLVDRVWDLAPPAQVRSAVYAHIVRIRRLLADATQAGGVALRLDRHTSGYLLDIDPDLVDLHRFRRLAQQARHQADDDEQRAQLLRQALGLWHGTPLAGLSGEWIDRVRDGCREQRLEALLAWADTELRLRNHEPVIDQVHQELGEYPLVEPLAATLIRALYAAGRTAEALDRYATTRQRLVDELGVDPGPELRTLHQAVLRGELDQPPPRAAKGGQPVPAQLPVDVRGFTGRHAELMHLDQVLDTLGQQPASVVIAAVSGTAGVGKTALAVHWAHRVADRFPDGQLFINLRGFDPGGRVTTAAEAVRGFLDALGVPPERIPPSLDAQTALYRSLIAGKRILVILDNARDAEHARPLLPGAPTCLALVTSRSQLTPMVAFDGAHPLSLDLLPTVEARELLARRLGTDCLTAEPDAVEQIVAACARLPLALAIAAARAQQTGFPLASLAAELDKTAQRLDALDAGDQMTQVRAVFSWSYTALTPPAARLFRLLALHPGPDISLAAAANLAGRSRSEAHRLLTELARASLIAEHTPGRYAFHDLLQSYAAELVDTHDPRAERHAAVTRMVDHYLHTARGGAQLLNPRREPPTTAGTRTAAAGVAAEHLTTAAEALAWFTAEHRVLLGVLRQAADTGFNSHAWQLAWATTSFLDRRGHWNDWLAAQLVALAAAQRDADPLGQAHAHRHLALAYLRTRDFGQAHTHFGSALRLFGELGDDAWQAHANLDLGWLFERQQRYREALIHAERAANLYRAAGDIAGQARSLNALGWCLSQLGEHRQALAHCQQALELWREIGLDHSSTWDTLGYLHHQLGDYRQAVISYQHAIEVSQHEGDRYNEADVATHLGDTHHAAGNPDAARAAWRQALDILTDLDHPDTQAVRARLEPPMPG